MAGSSFPAQLYSYYSQWKNFLDAVKVELGQTAKKVIGFIGIVLTCIVILAFFVEGYLGYYGHSNWYEGASVSPVKVPIPPGWLGAEDAAFTTLMAVIVLIVVPVTWAVGVFLASHYTLLALKETLREPNALRAIWAVVGNWGLPLLAALVAAFVDRRSYFPFSQFVLSPPVVGFAVGGALTLIPPLKKPHILYLQGLIELVYAGFSGDLSGILSFFYKMITSPTDIVIISKSTQTSGLWGAAFAFLALGFFTGVRGFFLVFFGSQDEIDASLTASNSNPALRASIPKKRGLKALYPRGCFLILVCIALLLTCVIAVPQVFGGTPQLASSYRGTIHQTGSKGDVVFILSSLQEGQAASSTSIYGNIAGQATFSPQIIPNGPFWGNVRSDRTMDFTIGNFFFTANLVNSVKTLSGTYDQQITNPANNTVTAGVGGEWQLTATS